MRKPRPATYNPAQALNLIANDRTGTPLSCPSCSGPIERTPDDHSGAAPLSRDAQVPRMRTRGPLHRRRRLSQLPPTTRTPAPCPSGRENSTAGPRVHKTCLDRL